MANLDVREEQNFDDVSLESFGTHLIFGDIEEDKIRDASTFVLKANRFFNQQELTIFINTLGGTTHDGFALIDLMEISRLPIRTVALGNICSMGVLMVAAGSKGKRIMTRNTQVMAHQFEWATQGKYHEMVASQKGQDNLAHQFIQHFLRHSSMKEKEIKSMLFGPSDVWLTPSECKKMGLIDVIVDELPPTAPEKPQTPAKKSKTRAR